MTPAMARKTPSEAEVIDTLSSLSLDTKAAKPLAKPKPKPVADSWDDGLSSASDTETDAPSTSASANVSRTTTTTATTTTTSSTPLSPVSTNASAAVPAPPPPTPASPTPFDFPEVTSSFGAAIGGAQRGPGSSGREAPTKRPEKTTAVAGRLIAGALGVRAPRRTEEEREFDRAVREKERRRREEQRERERREVEQAEARRRAVWED